MKKNIINFENYQIDEQGNVYNLSTNKQLQGSIGENGYRYYRLSNNGNKKMKYAHRLVAEHFLENPQKLSIVNHKDGNKLNNNVENLEWVSYSENTQAWHNLSKPQRKQTEYYDYDLPNEVWLKYGNYMVSSYGRVRHGVKNNILSPSIVCGYYKVRLSENGMASDYMIHKLVWQLFGDSNEVPAGCVIDHIDGNKLNNAIENLRCISLSENVNAAYYIQKTNSSAKRVQQFDINGKFIQDFPSVAEAARILNLDSSTISKVCRGKNKTHGGFVFKYSD